MSTKQFLKEGFHSHKASGVKIILVLIAIIAVLASLQSYGNSSRVRETQAKQSQAAIANHTQTLDEIQQAVTELKASNAADHTATIKYINCVLVGLSTAGASGNALPVYQTCLASSQLPVDPGN